MANRIIHLQTTISTTFAEVDEDGDVIKKFPLNLEVPKVSGDLFSEAVKALVDYKNKLINDVTKDDKSPF